MKKLNKKQLAYIAGLVDGEGWFSVRRNLRMNNTYGYYLCVGIKIREKFILEEIQTLFGGEVDERTDHRDGVGRIFEWRLFGKNALNFAKQIQDYVQVKQKQCDCLIKIGCYLENKTCGKKNNCSTYYKRLRKYNTRGDKNRSMTSKNVWLSK